MVRVFKLSILAWSVAACSVSALMNFEHKTVEQLVSILMDQNGDVEFSNVQASPIIDTCASYFTNGFSLGNYLNTTGGVDNGPLLDANGDPIPIVPDQGIILSSGLPSDFNNQTSDGKTTEFHIDYNIESYDWDLQKYVAKTVYDACWIKFNFKCTSEAYVPVVSFNYVFGSEEYYEYASTDFNDAFAFFLNGKNIATLPTTETDTDIVSINNVNYETNSQYFHGNDPGNNPDGNGPGYDPVGFVTKDWYQTVEADGLVSKLTARGYPKTTAGEQDWNTIKLVVADVGDHKLDSWVLLESGTFSCVDITSAPSVSLTPSTSEPTQTPTNKPTQEPTVNPTASPSQSPTQKPTTSPTGQPSISSMPSLKPSSSPSVQPSDSPSVSSEPSYAPSTSFEPSLAPSVSSEPSSSPSVSSAPSFAPSVSSEPSSSPTISSEPSLSPTTNPSDQPSSFPSVSSGPSSSPSANPTLSPKPTVEGSYAPSVSFAPSETPTDNPSRSPTRSPTKNPTTSPTDSPSVSMEPSMNPSSRPSVSSEPSGSPTSKPSASLVPSNSPTDQPSVSSKPSDSPTSNPSISSAPSSVPTGKPSISSAPSSNPSFNPSVSSAPSISPASIGPNTVFDDKDGDGVQDEGEPGLPNVVILLYKDGVQVGETTTNDEGVYEFPDLVEGSYYIQVKNDPAYTFSPIVDGGNRVSQDGSTDPITLKPGETADIWDVGMFLPVSLGNKVFDDLNGNAIQDAGEPGLEAVTVTLIKGSCESNGSCEEIANQLTAADGSYFFEGLPPGEYSVQFAIPESYLFIPPSNLNMDIINNGYPIEIPDYSSDLNTATGITSSHILESGEVDMTYDAAIFRPVSISGVTWHDLNANGIQDNGEPGLEGSLIFLHNDDGDVVDMQISWSDGSYSFDGLPPDGYYSVIMPPSPEYLLSPYGEGSVFDNNSYMSYPVTLQSGDSSNGANAGMFMLASIDDWVWEDAAPANGIQDVNEGGFTGPVTVKLYNSSGSVIKSTQTNSTGFYSFTDVVPGEYEIQFITEEDQQFTEQNAGEDDSKDSDVDLNGKASFTISSGEKKNIAAGITVLASVGPNSVFEDMNGNGIQDEGEAGEPGVVIHLVDGTGARIATTITDANGEYEFQAIPQGNYSIQVDLEESTTFSPVVDGGNQVSQVDGQMYGSSPVVELTVGTQEDTWNVGLMKPVLVGNKVWNDLNGNGIQDADEPGIEGVTAILMDGSGKELDTAVTDSNGLYLFENLAPGMYAVKFDIPEEYLFTPPAKTTTPITNEVDGSLSYEDVTSDVNVETGLTDTVMLSSGEHNLSFDAGIFIPVEISGTTWHDLNANGIKEEGEPGLSGSTVTLYDRDNDFVGIHITNNDGNFLFEDLPPGTYHTVLSPPSPEYLLSPKENDNDSDFNPDTFLTTPIVLNSGESGEGSFDAGLYLPAKIGDRVWYDEFPDGVQGGDEGAYDGLVTITLRDNRGFVVSTTTPETGSGFYQFDGLIPGTYELMAEIDELGYVFTFQSRGNDTSIDSDVSATTGKVTVTLTSGEDNNSIDIGIMDDAPYYPDWQNDNQICTNDGFDPEWLEIQRVNYLYKNKEACCKAHFWWRITQCMQNEEFKFYKNGEMCDTKIYFEDWESNSPADWTDTTQFDTLDECCVNMFWYDIDGCIERSPLMFKYEFCVDVKGLVEPQDCQSADIYANVFEDAINAGINLDAASVEDQQLTDANITSIGNVTLTKQKGGTTVCGGSMEGQDFINDKTGSVPDIVSAQETITTVCGVITVEEATCREKDCMMEHYQNLTNTMTEYVNDGAFKEKLNQRASTRLPRVPELESVSGVTGSFVSNNLLLPATITGEENVKFYHGSDLTSCMKKTFFLETETPYETLHECCKDAFHYDVRSCCINGGGCPELNLDESTIEYYPTWAAGKLCDSKPSISFDTWEVNRYQTVEECCDAFFPHQKTECVKQHDV